MSFAYRPNRPKGFAVGRPKGSRNKKTLATAAISDQIAPVAMEGQDDGQSRSAVSGAESSDRADGVATGLDDQMAGSLSGQEPPCETSCSGDGGPATAETAVAPEATEPAAVIEAPIIGELEPREIILPGVPSEPEVRDVEEIEVPSISVQEAGSSRSDVSGLGLESSQVPAEEHSPHPIVAPAEEPRNERASGMAWSLRRGG